MQVTIDWVIIQINSDKEVKTFRDILSGTILKIKEFW